MALNKYAYDYDYDFIAWPARVKPPAGPPWSVTDDDRRQTPESKTILPSYAMCRRTTNKMQLETADFARGAATCMMIFITQRCPASN